jgi:syntaxin 18
VEDGDDDADSFRSLESAKFLSEREKDEVDLRAKVIIKTCRERIRLLEAQEKGR